MSVIIKGVEMPSKCWSCPCCVDNGLIGRDRKYFCSALDSDFEIDNLEQRLSACPLKEIPTPHGRLIDADALIADLQGLRELFPSSNIDCFGGVISLVKNSSAIIEAEVSE